MIEVEEYANTCMKICGLTDWHFEWDRAVRRLGLCKMSKRVISISRYFVRANLSKDPKLIRSTILHEMAHALSWKYSADRTHGPVWRSWCAALGIPGEQVMCACPDFTPEHLSRPKYAVCHRDTGEIFCQYRRKPPFTDEILATGYVPGRKAETLGKLCIISLDPRKNSPKK